MITGPKALLFSLLACVMMASAVRADETIPSELQGIEIEERLGQQVPQKDRNKRIKQKRIICLEEVNIE